MCQWRLPYKNRRTVRCVARHGGPCAAWTPNVNPMIREKVVRAAENWATSLQCRREIGGLQASGYSRSAMDGWALQPSDRQRHSQGTALYRRSSVCTRPSSCCVPAYMQELLRAIEEQIRSGVDGLIIRAENTPEVRAAIEQAVQQGVTVITYDADVPDSGRLCYVGQDLVRAGAIAAGVMARLIPSARTCTHRLRQPAYGITHKGRVDGFCRRLLELGFSGDAYQVIRDQRKCPI